MGTNYSSGPTFLSSSHWPLWNKAQKMSQHQRKKYQMKKMELRRPETFLRKCIQLQLLGFLEKLQNCRAIRVFHFFFLTHAVIPSWEKWTRILDQEFFASSPFDPHNSLWNYNLKKILQAAAPCLSEMCCLSRSLKLESTLLCFKKGAFSMCASSL